MQVTREVKDNDEAQGVNADDLRLGAYLAHMLNYDITTSTSTIAQKR